MAGNDIQLVQRLLQHSGCLLRHIKVRSAMKSVLPDVVRLIKVIRESIHVCTRWHCLMEGCIKNSHLWAVSPEQLFGNLNAQDVPGVVQRGEDSGIANGLQNSRVYQGSSFKTLTAVNDSMTHRADAIPAGQQIHNAAQSRPVIWEIHLVDFFAFMRLLLDSALSLGGNALCQPMHHPTPTGRSSGNAKKSILHGAAPGIQHKK
mmetsp:Transcript_28519/g.66952  ORF Transcript_28519/g.66952 Transcript_28519/m.66952 type:complete len:204 (-) Transcript_28519:68-679(-)